MSAKVQGGTGGYPHHSTDAIPQTLPPFYPKLWQSLSNMKVWGSDATCMDLTILGPQRATNSALLWAYLQAAPGTHHLWHTPPVVSTLLIPIQDAPILFPLSPMHPVKPQPTCFWRGTALLNLLIRRLGTVTWKPCGWQTQVEAKSIFGD